MISAAKLAGLTFHQDSILLKIQLIFFLSEFLEKGPLGRNRDHIFDQYSTVTN